MSEKQKLQSLREELIQFLIEEFNQLLNFWHQGRDHISFKLFLACLGDTIITMRELLGNIEDLPSKQRDKKSKNQEEANKFRKDLLEKLKNEQNKR